MSDRKVVSTNENGKMVLVYISNENLDLLDKFLEEYNDAGVETFDDELSAMFALISNYIAGLNKNGE